MDAVLACFLPIVIGYLVYRTIPSLSWSEIRSFFTQESRTFRPFSVENAYYSYHRYRQLSQAQLNSMRNSYASVGRTHKRIGYDLGYPAKLNRLQETTEVNAHVTDAIARLAEREFPNLNDQWLPGIDSGNISRVRESLKHFVRDWSTDGAEERNRIIQPILDVLRLVDVDKRAEKRVLVPGSGLGRLAWEISQLGFNTTANELSFFMNLAFRFLLSLETTTRTDQHVLHPYGYWFSHQRSNDALFRAIRFPDVVPRLNENLHLSEGDFLNLSGQYDYVVTLFFIDTSLNILSTLEKIHSLLRPGGVWINLGPLLWCQAKLELSLEEVLAAARTIGFTFEHEPKTVECEYTHDSSAMMRWIYRAEFWVARKVGP
ncbi:N2227-domain-containing protein [Moniliophthora roreri MCA 2997]|uniref:N2227-domain-containing protein n=1 Tax=Moniliophthora roreri (strain MCA 2997) TaxID=1381753 RepID=V2XG24_MONRO|nr:N2227-domain-containing protein [Moniliophthora roreri MCA 2997]